MEDVRLWFEKGKVVKATAAKNEAFLLKMIETDEGRPSKIGSRLKVMMCSL
ncbi:unnamed protein product [marine sediment metagenome]|uniref:Uncharacterized protein n=1 Tax=marine sediment metagenome TaxID=412755 RepID=X1NWH8_9ZZZZ